MTHIRVHMYDTGEARLIGIAQIWTVMPATFPSAKSVVAIGASLSWFVRETVEEIEALLLAAAEPHWSKAFVNGAVAITA
jgi:hypothetical protein